MAIKLYGEICYESEIGKWRISKLEPHVCIKLKDVFQKIGKTKTLPFYFDNTSENCNDLLWFMQRYELKISEQDFKFMQDGKNNYLIMQHRLESILIPDYQPKRVILNDPYVAREYQLKAVDYHSVQKRFLLGDDIGLGKTLTGTMTFNQDTLPGLVVCQTHLTAHWKEKITEYSNLKVHIIKGTTPYSLPYADVYITTYSRISGWIDTYQNKPYKSVIFDEVQELRRSGSNKYEAAKKLVSTLDYVLGMSATPIYNYGDEIYTIMNLINEGCLGGYYDFIREWTNGGSIISEPAALGTYLREKHLFLRRTRKDVGRELPDVNKIIHTVDYDEVSVKKATDIAKILALKTVSGSFVERGQAARELDVFVRHETGLSKAKYVAEFVKMLINAGEEKILLVGWHRDVYDIWLKELSDYNPAMYTGSESPLQKEASKNNFIHGNSQILIMSLRSGIGLDGLQHACKCVVFGELDWSPKVHEQVIGRLDRDGQEQGVTSFYCVSDFGSDPVVIDILGLKSSQSHNIIDPMIGITQQFTDETHLTKLAQSFLNKTSLS